MEHKLKWNAQVVEGSIYFSFYLEALADEHEYKLINDLLANYNVYARPSLDHRDATNVTFGLSLSQLIDVVRHSCSLTWASQSANLLSFCHIPGREESNHHHQLLAHDGKLNGLSLPVTFMAAIERLILFLVLDRLQAQVECKRVWRPQGNTSTSRQDLVRFDDKTLEFNLTWSSKKYIFRDLVL